MLLLEKIRRKNQNLTISPRDPPTQFPEAFTNDLMIEMFSRLPAKSIARCRCVSKLWESTLLRKEFTDLYLTRSSSHPQLLLSCIKNGNIHFFSASHEIQKSDYGIVVVVANYHTKLNFNTLKDHTSKFCGSVNGLVCVTNVRICEEVCEIVPVICNISTGQSLLNLPILSTKKNMSMFEVESFFGYDPVGKQFKILSMMLPRRDYVDVRIRGIRKKISGEYRVLTLGVKKLSWRMVGCSMDHTPSPLNCGVCINGVLYYAARKEWVFAIVCFDFRSEKFKFIQKGKELDFLEGSTLVNYNGKLGVFISPNGEKGLTGISRSFEIRVLEDLKNVVWSKHVYELPSTWKTDHTLYFFGVTGTNEIVLASYYLSDPFYVFYYNTEKKTVRGVEIGGMAAFKNCEIRACADHVENVKLLEMFKT